MLKAPALRSVLQRGTQVVVLEVRPLQSPGWPCCQRLGQGGLGQREVGGGVAFLQQHDLAAVSSRRSWYS